VIRKYKTEAYEDIRRLKEMELPKGDHGKVVERGRCDDHDDDVEMSMTMRTMHNDQCCISRNIDEMYAARSLMTMKYDSTRACQKPPGAQTPPPPVGRIYKNLEMCNQSGITGDRVVRLYKFDVVGLGVGRESHELANVSKKVGHFPGPATDQSYRLAGHCLLHQRPSK